MYGTVREASTRLRQPLGYTSATAVHFAGRHRKEARAMITVHDLKAWKAEGRRFTMLTAYDFPTAQILDRAGVPILLVGDSVGNNG